MAGWEWAAPYSAEVEFIAKNVLVPALAAVGATVITIMAERRKRGTEQRTAAAMMATHLGDYHAQCRREWIRALENKELSDRTPQEEGPSWVGTKLKPPLDSSDLKQLVAKLPRGAAAVAFGLHLNVMRTLDTLSIAPEEPYGWDDEGPINLAGILVETDQALRVIANAGGLKNASSVSSEDAKKWLSDEYKRTGIRPGFGH